MTRLGRRRSAANVMRTDDEVAPGTHRAMAGVLAAVGLGIVIVTTTMLIWAVQQRADLSASEVVELRGLLQSRVAQRDAERDAAQRQLDEQARVLCGVLEDFRAQPGGRPAARMAIVRAQTRLGCSRFTSQPLG